MGKHELRDANFRGVVLFGLGLFVLIAAALFAMDRLFDYLAAQPEAGPPPSSMALSREVPPLPRLQVSGTVDLKRFREAEEKVLNSYAWVDRDAGIVRIPVERAIELLAERGLPARATDKERGDRK